MSAERGTSQRTNKGPEKSHIFREEPPRESHTELQMLGRCWCPNSLGLGSQLPLGHPGAEEALHPGLDSRSQLVTTPGVTPEKGWAHRWQWALSDEKLPWVRAPAAPSGNCATLHGTARTKMWVPNDPLRRYWNHYKPHWAPDVPHYL